MSERKHVTFTAPTLFNKSCAAMRQVRRYSEIKSPTYCGLFFHKSPLFSIEIPYHLSYASYEEGVLLCKLGAFSKLQHGALKAAFYAALLQNSKSFTYKGQRVKTREVFRADFTWVYEGKRYTTILWQSREILRFYLTKARANTNFVSALAFDKTYPDLDSAWEYLKDYIAITEYEEPKNARTGAV